MQRVTHDGRDTAYRVSDRGGDGPTVCFVHGSGGSKDVWKAQARLSDRFLVVALDLSGHGDSDDADAPPGRETLDAYADDVVAVAEATDATVLCGNSLGGAVALWVALERDLPLDGLVLAGTGARLAVVGEHDALTPPEYHDYLADRIADCERAAIEGAAHLAMIERPAAFNAALSSFLGRRSGGSE